MEKEQKTASKTDIIQLSKGKKTDF